MPVDKRATKTAERCHVHPTRGATARCDRCGRPICLSCAVPVRGEVLGPSCVAELLAAEGADTPPPPTPGLDRPTLIAGAGLCLSLVGTLLPWTTFGEGSGFAGAWGASPRWSMLVAVASVMGLVGWIAAARRRPVVADWIALAASIAIAVGSLLAFGNPPSFTKPSVGPWVSLAGAVVAGSAAMVAVRRSAAVE